MILGFIYFGMMVVYFITGEIPAEDMVVVGFLYIMLLLIDIKQAVKKLG